MNRPRRLLFVCVENSCRSQIAEAFARMIGGEHVEVSSGGSRPSGVVHPRAVAVMAELDYDLTAHASSGLDEVPAGTLDAVVTMGCGDACPQVPARRRDDWAIPDPKEMPLEAFREVRDEIGRRVRELLTDLGVPPRPRPRAGARGASAQSSTRARSDGRPIR